jgi:hypothetical protein
VRVRELEGNLKDREL